jgi:NAD(P)-dependent dehydrogenase (short-subunit alcohol dehydrogenase family)
MTPDAPAGTEPAEDPLTRFRLDGKRAIVTGASSGLGAGFAVALARSGATVAIGARRGKQLDDTAERIRSTGRSALARALDVTDETACTAFVDAVVAELGGVDILINNAGIVSAAPALHEAPEVFRSVIDTNLLGSYWMARACARVMGDGASIVNIASVHGLAASLYPQAAYAASKAAIIGLTRDLAQQWSSRRGIRVNALAPGYFQTEMTAEYDALERMVRDHSLLRRAGRQEEIDAAMLFLASPASSYITGTTLIIDGGMSATI